MSISIVSKHAALAAGVFGLAVAIASAPASAQRKSAQEQRKEQVAQIPTCAKPLGSISVIEPEDATNWWTGQQLPASSPSSWPRVLVEF